MNRSEKKIKIAVVAPATSVLGGQSIQAERLIEAFRGEEEFELALIPNNPSIGVLAFLQKIKFVRTLSTSAEFWRLLLTKIPRFDIVHVFSSGTTSYVISTLPALFAAKFFGKKTILHYHTGEAREHLEKWGWTATSSMREFDRIIVPSEYLVQIFRKFGIEARAIFNFVDAEKFRFRHRSALKPVFLSNRNFEKHYDVGCALRAFQKIQKEFPEARLFVAGSGGEESGLRGLAAELNLKNTEFTGKIAPDEMARLYEKADIFLNSSRVDNMPLSIIEAFASGLAVVSTDAGGIPFLVKHEETGLLSAPGDCRALAENALRLLRDEALSRKIIEKARSECVKYSWDEVRGEWSELYRKILK